MARYDACGAAGLADGGDESRPRRCAHRAAGEWRPLDRAQGGAVVYGVDAPHYGHPRSSGHWLSYPRRVFHFVADRFAHSSPLHARPHRACHLLALQEHDSYLAFTRSTQAGTTKSHQRESRRLSTDATFVRLIRHILRRKTFDSIRHYLLRW